MAEAEWNSAPIADLLLFTLDIHRARYGAEPVDTAWMRPPTAALRCDLGRKHMLPAFAVVRRYWAHLARAARRTITAQEAVEEGERERDPLGDDSGQECWTGRTTQTRGHFSWVLLLTGADYTDTMPKEVVFTWR